MEDEALGHWYLTNRDRCEEIVRGPYTHAESAGAVRAEMENQSNRWANTNLGIFRIVDLDAHYKYVTEQKQALAEYLKGQKEQPQ
jgi:hypothetical protein